MFYSTKYNLSHYYLSAIKELQDLFKQNIQTFLTRNKILRCLHHVNNSYKMHSSLVLIAFLQPLIIVTFKKAALYHVTLNTSGISNVEIFITRNKIFKFLHHVKKFIKNKSTGFRSLHYIQKCWLYLRCIE